MNQEQNKISHHDISASDSNDNEIDFLGLLQTVGENKWLLLGIPFLFSTIVAVYSLNLTPMYTAKATFMLPEKQSSSSASVVLEQLGGLAGNFGKNTTEMYIAIMQSNIVQDVIIAEFDLMQRYKTKTQEDTRKTLQGLVKITTDKKSGLFIIEVQDQSPDMAAKLANSYLKPLRAVLNRISLEDAQLRRDFFAQQVEMIAQRPFRDPFTQSTLLNSMIKQYEAARIDQGRESQFLFPIDVAKSPERKSSPKRLQLVLIAGFSVFFLVLLWVLIKKAFWQANTSPVLSQKLAITKKAWKFRA